MYYVIHFAALCNKLLHFRKLSQNVFDTVISFPEDPNVSSEFCNDFF